ncbi:endolytic transglycosylase MltG [Pararhodospirillum oryzae]|uniref:Endolytic murein transglycosylase n=1 Tax=Pararhodospirillum oryzae TaxID=478448 RepID=A0A512H7J2_9PROT|nr:endolytic transglycosylase MltG [Pararhodospirillum oryzae]GEO81419.1 aminodeoxychorismate lyase [Pararhodospirillum oryzae]
MRALLRVALWGVLALALAGGGLLAALRGVEYLFDEPGPLGESRTVEIPAGGGVTGIATTLAQAGVITHPLVFEAGVRLAGRGRDLKAGEYEFAPHSSARAVMESLVAGRVKVYRLTVPEGLTSAAIVDLIRDVPELKGDVGDIPPEGALLPETYHYQRGDTRARVIERMAQARATTLATLWAQRAPDLPFDTPEEAVILASVVERETGINDERARVAGVFVNRLRKGMPLQSDPTVIYGLSEGSGALGRSLTRADLGTAHAWNTYLIAGLPPSPICNPGREALQAVLHPAATRDLYFVADGTGGHRFAETLDEHNRNVRAYRRFLRDANATE